MTMRWRHYYSDNSLNPARRPGSRRRLVDLVDLAAPSQVKSFQLQVDAEF